MPYSLYGEVEINEERKKCFFKFSFVHNFLIICYHIINLNERHISFCVGTYEILSFQDKKIALFMKRFFPEKTYKKFTDEKLQGFIDCGNFLVDKRSDFFKILKCFHIQINGKLVLGFDDPFYTGSIFGLLQSFIDAIPNNQFEITPDFSRSCLFTHTKVRVRFWIPQIAIHSIPFIFNKNGLRLFLTKI